MSAAFNPAMVNTKPHPAANPQHRKEKCRICTYNGSSLDDIVWHVVSLHKFDDPVKACAEGGNIEGQMLCRFCRTSFADLKEFVRHLRGSHQSEFVSAMCQPQRNKKKQKCSEAMSEYFKDKGMLGKPKREEPAPPRWNPKMLGQAPVPAPEEEKEDERYLQTIAGTINLQGMESSHDVPVGEIKPLDISRLQTKQEATGGGVDAQFWHQLDRLDVMLHAQMRVDTDGEKCMCNICRKNCKSYVKLLQHCWETHKDFLDRM